MEWLQRLDGYIRAGLWKVDLRSLSRPRALLVKALRLLYVTGKEVTEAQLALRAMGLVYTTLLALVPLLAVGFSVLKAFGVHNRVEPLLSNLLLPLGEKGAEITQRIIEFVNNMNVGVLGFLGLALLVYTVISLLKKIEEAFNSIWRVRTQRSFARRFSDYMSVVLVGPLLVVSAMGITASVMSSGLMQELLAIEPLGTLINVVVRLLPYVLVCAAFTFIYSFVPNTKVDLGSSVVGGVVGGVLWETAGWGFASFIVTSTKYTAIYSGFAILVFFMIWLYLSWLVLLIGAVVSFYHQHPHIPPGEADVRQFNTRLMERTAFLVMALIGHHFYQGRKPWTLEALADYIGLPFDFVLDAVEKLERAGLVTGTGEADQTYLPAKDMESITLREIVNAVRMSGESLPVQRTSLMREVERVISGIDKSIEDAVGGETLRDLVHALKEEVLSPEGQRESKMQSSSPKT